MVRTLGIPWLGVPVAGRYRVVDRLSGGTTVRVLRAVDVASGVPVVLKVASEATDGESAERIRREARALLRVDHPNVVRVLDVGEHAGVAFVALAHVEGKTLRATLDAASPLPAIAALDIAIPVADALGHAHSVGVLHRDVKPANVVLTEPSGAPCLVDFGIAHLPGSITLTAKGSVLGTPAYLAPELLEGAVWSTAADVYALGVVLFEMFAGRLPHPTERTVDALRRRVREDAPRLASVRPEHRGELDDLVASCLERDPAARCPEVRVVRDGLARLREAAASRHA